MTTRKLSSMWPKIAIPLRDASRAAHEVVELSKGIVNQTADHLPAPISDMVQRTITVADKASLRASAAIQPNSQDMKTAHSVLNGESECSDEWDSVVRVLVYGIERGLGTEHGARLLVSETMTAIKAAEALGSVPPNAGPEDRTAELLERLLAAHVVGRIPGTELATDSSDQKQIRLALASSALWMLAERSGVAENEDRILELSVGLALAAGPELTDAFGNKKELSRVLKKYSELI